MIEVHDGTLDLISDWFEGGVWRTLYSALLERSDIPSERLASLVDLMEIFIVISNYEITLQVSHRDAELYETEEFFSKWYDVEEHLMFGLEGPAVATRLPLHRFPHIKE